jgi:GNAT superfamily N-acetyltransferase
VPTLTGECFCGAIRYEARGTPFHETNCQLLNLSPDNRGALRDLGPLWTESQYTRKLVSRNKVVDAEVTIRPFAEHDAAQVRELFITVNRLLSPPDLRDAFEVYIEHALAEEIDRISAYYDERDGCFWVAVRGEKVVGTFGLERASDDAMELRRMYVDPSARRRGIARRMLQFAEDECRRRNVSRLELSTAEIQQAALALQECGI